MPRRKRAIRRHIALLSMRQRLRLLALATVSEVGAFHAKAQLEHMVKGGQATRDEAAGLLAEAAQRRAEIEGTRLDDGPTGLPWDRPALPEEGQEP